METLCRVQDDSLMAAIHKIMPKYIEETVMFKDDEDTFESLSDKHVSFSSVNDSLSGRQTSSR